MKPRNAVYVGGPALDPPEEEPRIYCMFCKKRSPRFEWVRNHDHCPACHEEAAAGPAEED